MPPSKKTKLASGSAGSNALAGLTFAITGPLSKPRSHWDAEIKANGGKLAGSVTNAVNYLLTTDGEILVNTIKIQDARAKGIPFLSEAAITDTIATGEWPEDLSDYVLDGSPPLKRTAAKKSTAAAAAPARAKKTKATLEEADEEASAPARKKTVATKPTRAKASAAKKAEEEEEEAPAPARGKAKAAAAAAKATSSRAASADMDVDPTPEAKAPAMPAKTTDTTPALERGPTALDMTDKRSEVVFSFDTTGSMYPCLTVLRLKIKECVERLFSEIGAENLRVGITAHGDYCDAGSTYVTKHLPLTSNIKQIVSFVDTVGHTGGGDAPECYELVLHEAQSFPWTAGWNHVLVLIGDELPHEANANPNKLDWKTELGKLKAMGVQVHGVQALNRKHATKFYAACANMTGGCHLPLDQFNAITDLVMAACYREARPTSLERFEKEVQTQGRMNRSVQTMFDRMLGRNSTTAVAPGDMNAVTPGRFQVLDVDHDVDIKTFVQRLGVTFKTGRGFYEFTKPEVIQDYKEIILMDPSTGDMFEGDYARTLINAPKGGAKGVRISPGELDFIVFVQSTSHNRKLIGGTRFLYEIEEGY